MLKKEELSWFSVIEHYELQQGRRENIVNYTFRADKNKLNK